MGQLAPKALFWRKRYFILDANYEKNIAIKLNILYEGIKRKRLLSLKTPLFLFFYY